MEKNEGHFNRPLISHLPPPFPCDFQEMRSQFMYVTLNTHENKRSSNITLTFPAIKMLEELLLRSTVCSVI